VAGRARPAHHRAGLERLQPAAHVERHDRGRGVRDPADHPGDPVRGPVVQQPAEHDPEAALDQLDQDFLGAVGRGGDPVRGQHAQRQRLGQPLVRQFLVHQRGLSSRRLTE
jgi:hypothetical protein